MEKWFRLGEKLRHLINPSAFPVAVKFLEDVAQIPSKAKRPIKDMKGRWSQKFGQCAKL
jgi:uncharacterized protein (DUF169 family)